MNRFAVVCVTLCAFGPAADAQFLDASGTIRAGAAGQTSHYDLTVTDLGTTTIGTFWYAQFAGLDFLASAPVSIESPPGWTSLVTHNDARPDGFGIQWTATTDASRLPAGATLAGFGFDTTDPRDQVIGFSVAFPTFPTGTSVVNSGGPTSDFGAQIDVMPISIPGDANLDGAVGFADLLVLAQNFGRPGDFIQGNFNGDFFVNFADLLILAQNYGQTAQAGSTGVFQVPEPSTTGVLAFLGSLCPRRRRRHSDTRCEPNAKGSTDDLPADIWTLIRRGCGFIPDMTQLPSVGAITLLSSPGGLRGVRRSP